MRNFLAKLGSRWFDVALIAVPAGGAVACWYYQLPVWMLVICLFGVAVAVVSLLGELGLFGGDSGF